VPTPRPLEVLFHSPLTCQHRPGFADVTYYTAPSGAGVFSAGTQWWICGVDPGCTKPGADAPAVVRTISAITTRLLDADTQGPPEGSIRQWTTCNTSTSPVPAPRYPLRCPTLSYPTESEAHAHPLPVFPATTVFFPRLVQRGVHRRAGQAADVHQLRGAVLPRFVVREESPPLQYRQF